MEIYAAGTAAVFTLDVLVYPLDTLKTRYQSQDYLKTYAPGSSTKALSLRGLYQGVGSVVLATLPAAGLFFSTYESAKTVFGTAMPMPEPLVYSSVSAVAEMAACLVLVPAEVIKQNRQILRIKQQPGHDRDSTSIQALRQIEKGGAARRLFTAYTALVARNLPFSALQFPMFESIRTQVWKARRRRRPGNADKPQGLVETGLITAGSAR